LLGALSLFLSVLFAGTVHAALPIDTGQLKANHPLPAPRGAMTAASAPSAKPKPLVLLGPLAPLRQALRAGRTAEAIRLGQKLAPTLQPVLRQQAEALWGEALRQSGQLQAAEKLLSEAVARDPLALDARLELGLCYRQRGERAKELAVWNQFFDDHDAGNLDLKDPRVLRLLGVAARYLGSYKDANDTLREAVALATERKDALEVSRSNVEWAALFLEKYRADHAEESLGEALEVDPENPDALALMARVELERGSRITDAEDHIAEALRLNKLHPLALELRAEILIDNEQYEEALPITAQLLAQNPTNLMAHSLRAAAFYLLDRTADFESEKTRTLAIHPTCTSFFRTIAEQLTIQHRYDEAVALLEAAIGLYPKDYYALGDLGSGYLRLGQDDKGLDALRRAWKGDHYNQRVLNLLNLFEKTIPASYTVLTLDIDPLNHRGQGGLRLRIPKTEEALLLPLLVPLVQAEWRELSQRYEFTPKLPVTLELFSDADDYAIRTVGLPGLAALGVTFGQVVTGRSPAQGDFNWALMVWHELSHVFAIQLSRSRVPRWFTEGLSEWETTHARPLWVRRTHAELYAALRDGTLLSLADLNTGFTRAQDVAHIVVAYHEAALAIDFLVRHFGFAKITQALRLFAAGKRAREVLTVITGQSIAALDQAFRADLTELLAAYKGTFFVRPSDYSDRDGLEKAIEETKKRGDHKERLAKLHGLYAIGLLRSGAGQREEDRIESEIAAAVALDPGCKEALLAEGERLLKRGKKTEAEARLRALIAMGGDGFDVRQRLGDLYIDLEQPGRAIEELERAKRLDPDRAEPYERLAGLYAKQGRKDQSLAELRAAARLDIMDAPLAAKLVAKLHEAKNWQGVIESGELARQLSPYLPELRAQIGEAFLRLGRRKEAEVELAAALQALPTEQSAAGNDGGPEENASPDTESLAQRRASYQALLNEARGETRGPVKAPPPPQRKR
jgi:tetratricopeptide (TPR) repeat protein